MLLRASDKARVERLGDCNMVRQSFRQKRRGLSPPYFAVQMG